MTTAIRRAALVATVLWVLLALALAASDYRFQWDIFLIGGLGIPALLWGIWWIIRGLSSHSR